MRCLASKLILISIKTVVKLLFQKLTKSLSETEPQVGGADEVIEESLLQFLSNPVVVTLSGGHALEFLITSLIQGNT